jgi:flagellar motor switch protein FliN/FliY
MDVNDEPQGQGATGQEGEVAAGAGASDGPGDNYERATFDELGGGAAGVAAQGQTSLDVILDIPVTLSMEIGRSRISIENLLQLAKGSVVELDRMAGEPLDVLVNGTLVARGEVVVVNDKFGVRLSDVISPTERVKSLK